MNLIIFVMGLIVYPILLFYLYKISAKKAFYLCCMLPMLSIPILFFVDANKNSPDFVAIARMLDNVLIIVGCLNMIIIGIFSIFLVLMKHLNSLTHHFKKLVAASIFIGFITTYIYLSYSMSHLKNPTGLEPLAFLFLPLWGLLIAMALLIASLIFLILTRWFKRIK